MNDPYIQLAELTDRFDKFRLSHQKDIDGLTEKQKKGEAMYQNCVKEKNSILTQLATKESEIGKFRRAFCSINVAPLVLVLGSMNYVGALMQEPSFPSFLFHLTSPGWDG